MYVGIAAVLALQVAFVHAPFMNWLFGSAPLPAQEWVKAILVASTVLPAVAFTKWWSARRALPAPDAPLS